MPKADKKVLEFPGKTQPIDKRHNTFQKAYYDLFPKTKKQGQIISDISNDVGSMFNLINLPQKMLRELIGSATLKAESKDIFFKIHYTQILLEVLEYLESFEETNKTCGR